MDARAGLQAEVAVARHALQRGGNCRGSILQFFGEPRANGHLVLFQHFPDGFQIIFLRYACFFSPQRNLYLAVVLCSRFSLRPLASWSTRRLMPSNTRWYVSGSSP